jgi:hypothetical protein
MAKKQFFAIIDTETAIDSTVADCGIVICDRQGVVVAQMGVLVKDVFDTKELFYTPNDSGVFGKAAAERRKNGYLDMLNDGRRTLASVPAINRWIAKAIGTYDPVITAYNWAFDRDKASKTGIDLTGFKDSFCLWHAAVGNICNTKAFKAFALQNHAFTNVTDKGNMCFKTNAEIVAGFLAGEFTEEPHTALEDAVYFELPILKHILKKRDWKQKIEPFNWRTHQVKDHFVPK